VSAAPDVSVVIPTRESASILRRALASVTRQRQLGQSVEVVVVDQQSTDGTLAVARSFGASIVRTERPPLYAPPTRSRNLGADVAQGEFLLHLDADMTLTDGLLARALASCRENGHVAVTLEEIDVTSGFWAACKALERSTYRGSPVLEGARFVRAKTFHDVGGYDEELGSGEDWDIHARYAGVGSIGRLPKGVMHHLGAVAYHDQIRKKFLYGQSSASFLSKHDANRYSHEMMRAYVRSWRTFVSRPALAAGFVSLRLGEAGAVAAGFAIARRRGASRR
jgi:glycosyltransferase involved in cell wall biosynthesis